MWKHVKKEVNSGWACKSENRSFKIFQILLVGSKQSPLDMSEQNNCFYDRYTLPLGVKMLLYFQPVLLGFHFSTSILSFCPVDSVPLLYEILKHM